MHHSFLLGEVGCFWRDANLLLRSVVLLPLFCILASLSFGPSSNGCFRGDWYQQEPPRLRRAMVKACRRPAGQPRMRPALGSSLLLGERASPISQAERQWQ